MASKKGLHSVTDAFDRMLLTGSDWLTYWGSQDVHHIVMTGLSRSGKSMLFTSLMALLLERHRASASLPLLKALPLDRVASVDVRPIAGETVFPLADHLDALQAGQWPPATEQVYGFELVLTLQSTFWVKRALGGKQQVVFRFYDYPGEWLTDLPMLNQSFTNWSNAAWAQQMNRPQRTFAQAWQEWVAGFDFDQTPDDSLVDEYVQAYRGYLQAAKSGGISLLQPGALLLPNEAFDWRQHGFAPLPTAISSDPAHPWTQRFQGGFTHFQTQWLQPLRERYFVKADKQVILVDVLEGLSHGRAHLNQLKESVSHLASVLVTGARKWYRPAFLSKGHRSRVAFVATKVDLVPLSEQPALMGLLQDMTAGARSQLSEQQVDFQHFLVSAIQTTDAGQAPNQLRYTRDTSPLSEGETGGYVETTFEPIPSKMTELGESEHYPLLRAAVPKDWWTRVQHAQSLDRLFEYLIGAK